jgi:hypothetical protein
LCFASLLHFIFLFLLMFCKRNHIFNWHASKGVECGIELLLQWNKRFVNIKRLFFPFLMMVFDVLLIILSLLIYCYVKLHFLQILLCMLELTHLANFMLILYLMVSSFVNVLLFHFVASMSSVF